MVPFTVSPVAALPSAKVPMATAPLAAQVSVIEPVLSVTVKPELAYPGAA